MRRRKNGRKGRSMNDDALAIRGGFLCSPVLSVPSLSADRSAISLERNSHTLDSCTRFAFRPLRNAARVIACCTGLHTMHYLPV